MVEFFEKKEKNQHREWFIERAVEFMDKGHPGVAKQFFKNAGLNEQEIDLLVRESLEQAKIPGGQEEQKQRPEEIELTPRDKIRLKEVGLTFAATNQKNTAEVCFRQAGISDKKIKSLLNLNLVRIDQEKEKLKEELAKIEQGT